MNKSESLEFIEKTLEMSEDSSLQTRVSFLTGAMRMLIRYIRELEVGMGDNP